MEFGLLGNHITHSFSKVIHGLIDNYDYMLVDLPKEDFEKFMTRRDFKGINVTIPYKKNVMKYLTYISPEAKEIGSVNTIVNKNGELYGYNTDYLGFEYMLRSKNIPLKNQKVIILGSGGTSLMAQFVSKKQGAKSVTVISRSGNDNYENISRHYDADIIVNTTPVGTFPNNTACPLEISQFSNLKGVVDVIYNPLKSNLLIQAKDLNVAYTNGLPMLVAQAKYAAEHFMGKLYDDSLIERIYTKLKLDFTNIVLIGMSGSGKSTLGYELAKRLDRKFVDTDTVIEQKCGITIPEIFSIHGEEYFRKLEKEVCLDVSKEKNLVISTGGGLPIDKENRNFLLWNGYIIAIVRDLAKLDTAGRPLVKDNNAICELYNKRKDIYDSLADLSVNNDKSVDEIVSEILSHLKSDIINS